jgi:malonyl-CoA/methylmalonyl-CoA synthetase
MTDHNLYAALRAGFPAALDAVAIETADTPAPLYYTWRDLDRASAKLANLLASLGLPPASRIAVHVDKSVEALLLYLAVLRAGHVCLPLNPAYQAAELEYFIADAEPALLVCSPRNLAWVAPLAARRGTPHVLTLGDDRSGSLLERAAAADERQRPLPRAADDLAAIVYTSGTTGRSKGAMLTHGNLLSNAQVLHTAWGWDEHARGADRADGGDVLIHALPIFHVHGLFVAGHGALLSGSRMLWYSKFDAAAVLARLPEATVLMGVPTMYVRLLAEPGLDRAACRRIRLFVSGSAPLLAATFAEWERRSGQRILERYGMSETVMLTSNPYRPAAARRPGTVGWPLPGTGVRVCDGSGRPLPAGEVGGVEVRGPSVFKGYWRRPDQTAADFTADGWFRTGDVGRIAADGCLSLVGRSKDLVISGGYNVYPAEVEGHLNALPGVAESAVIGVPHADYGEAVVALVVPRPGARPDAQALVAALKAQIAGFKVPKRVLLVDALPRNAMGKVQKNLLREQHRDLLAGA